MVKAGRFVLGDAQDDGEAAADSFADGTDELAAKARAPCDVPPVFVGPLVGFGAEKLIKQPHFPAVDGNGVETQLLSVLGCSGVGLDDFLHAGLAHGLTGAFECDGVDTGGTEGIFARVASSGAAGMEFAGMPEHGRYLAVGAVDALAHLLPKTQGCAGVKLRVIGVVGGTGAYGYVLGQD